MKVARKPWMKFYPSDWRADAMLRLCSIGARGLWAEMMCIMHEADPYGSLLVNSRRIDKKQLAGLSGITEKECTALLIELEGHGVFSRDDDGTIYSRRMRRDFEKAEKDKENGLDGGNPTIRRGTVPKEHRVRPYRRSDAPEKTLRIFAKTDGKCHWCNTPLAFKPDGSANGFHVDHLLPVCDGGTNDEENLVPACASCNHKRARLDIPTASPVNVGKSSDVKAQRPETIVQSKDDDDDARARPPLISAEANKLADECAKIAGHDLAFVPPSWYGAAYRAQTWLNEGWPEEIILLSVREQTAKKRDGPPSRIDYFEKGIAAAIARANAPLPIATISEISKDRHAAAQGKSGLAAIDRVFAAIQDRPEALAGPNEGAVLGLPARSIQRS